jgi:hypothetical protein
MNLKDKLREIGISYAAGNYDRSDIGGLIEDCYWEGVSLLIPPSNTVRPDHFLHPFFIKECTRAVSEFASSLPPDKVWNYSAETLANCIVEGYQQVMRNKKKKKRGINPSFLLPIP